jgi:hypothetical protein
MAKPAKVMPVIARGSHSGERIHSHDQSITPPRRSDTRRIVTSE